MIVRLYLTKPDYHLFIVVEFCVCVNFFFLRSFIFLFKCLLSSYLITISLALFFENAARFLFQLLKYLSIVFLSLSLLLNFKLIFRLFSSSFLFFFVLSLEIYTYICLDFFFSLFVFFSISLNLFCRFMSLWFIFFS